MQYHPDKNPGNEFTSARFLEVQEAYQTLSDARRRAKYDDERWLMGHKKNYRKETVNADWLLDVCIKLNKSLDKMDTHRISHGALAEYILLILSDAHIGILQQEQDKSKNNEIITHLLNASDRLEPSYMEPIINRLIIVAGNSPALEVVTNYATLRNKEAIREKWFPYVIIAITLALCLFMYFYGSI